MDEQAIYFEDISQAIEAIPMESIVSRTFLRAGKTKVILFAFDKGQELSEHTAAVPAILHFLDGKADITFGEERQSVGPGAWVYLPARLKHSITALTPLKMLLYMLAPNDAASE